jgi:tetratricopeptide (TPR) repeat protein
MQGSFDRASRLLEEAVELQLSLESTQHVISTLGNLGWTELGRRRPERAAQHFERWLELACALGDNWEVAGGLISLAEAKRQLGELDAAEQLLRDGLRVLPTSNRQRRDLLDPLEIAARIAADRRDYRQAVELLAAATTLREAAEREEAVVPMNPTERFANDQLRESLHAALPLEEYVHHWAAGTVLDVDVWITCFQRSLST